MIVHSNVSNLVANALRYGTPADRVAASLHGLVERIDLVVENDGLGIPLAEQAHVFDRFVRGERQDVAGTGLGAAIVKQAVERSCGEIEVSSGIGERGVAFTVRLPRTGASK